MNNPSRFQTTSWSLVLAAGIEPAGDTQPALEALCRIYWLPVYAFIRRNGYDHDQAQDLAQGFFALVIEKHYFHGLNRERGKFRTFLLTAVKHFLANELDRANALKRGGRVRLVSIDTADAERWYLSEVADNVTPEVLYHRRWARSLLERVMARLRSELEASGKAVPFDRLSGYLSGDGHATPYEKLAAELGVSAGALRVTVHRWRRRYRDLLRKEILETVASPEEVEVEIRFLLAALST